MTEDRLKHLEEGNAGSVFPDATKTELCAEVRRCWAEIEFLESKHNVITAGMGDLKAERDKAWAEIEELKKSQGVSPKPFEDPCIYMAGGPDV